MRTVSIPIKSAVIVLAVALLLGMALMLRHNTKPASHPKRASVASQTVPCTGVLARSAAWQGASEADPPHAVILSWNAVAPASTSPRDAIQGYYVYRSLTSRTYAESHRISESPVQGTRCVDTTVEPGKAYFYVVRALTEGGTQSGSSIEIRAVVPFP